MGPGVGSFKRVFGGAAGLAIRIRKNVIDQVPRPVVGIRNLEVWPRRSAERGAHRAQRVGSQECALALRAQGHRNAAPHPLLQSLRRTPWTGWCLRQGHSGTSGGDPRRVIVYPPGPGIPLKLRSVKPERATIGALIDQQEPSTTLCHRACARRTDQWRGHRLTNCAYAAGAKPPGAPEGHFPNRGQLAHKWNSTLLGGARQLQALVRPRRTAPRIAR